MLEGDRDVLHKQYTECKDYKEKIRYQALYAISRNFSVEDTAAFLDVEESTVYDWIHKWQQEKEVKDKPRSGRPEKLTEKDDEEIRDIIDNKSPKDFGINSATWTTKELHEYFALHHHKLIDEETLRVHLKGMGAHYVKSQLQYAEGDEDKKIEFARNFCRISTNEGFSKVIFVDEMSVSTSAHSGYGWTFRERLVVEAPQSKKEHANYFGAVEVIEGKIIEVVRKSAKVDSFIALLDKIQSTYPNDKTLICMDNGRVHHASKVDEFFRKHYKLKSMFLPPYSPDINPEEYMHNYLRNKLLRNHNFMSTKQIGHVIGSFVKQINSATVRSVATLIPIEALLSDQNQL